MKNFFVDVPENLRDELIEIVLQASNFSLERIVSRGHCSPEGFWYDQDDNEWVILLKGGAHLRFADQEDAIILAPGDYLHIDRGRRHRVEWTDPGQDTVWLALRYGDLAK
jgi:cupin 2 domain-containing protein